MEIKVNGRAVDSQVKVSTNLEDLLVDLSENCLPEDHLVGTVRLNGNEFNEAYSRQARDICISTVNNLDITTVSLEQFACAAIKDCAVFLDNIAQCTIKTAELFRIADECEANEQYAKLIDSLRALYQFIDQSRQVTRWNFDKSMYERTPIRDHWVRLTAIVDDLKNIQEESDWVLLADLLEYELTPCLMCWREICASRALEMQLG